MEASEANIQAWILIHLGDSCFSQQMIAMIVWSIADGLTFSPDKETTQRSIFLFMFKLTYSSKLIHFSKLIHSSKIIHLTREIVCSLFWFNQTIFSRIVILSTFYAFAVPIRACISYTYINLLFAGCILITLTWWCAQLEKRLELGQDGCPGPVICRRSLHGSREDGRCRMLERRW